MLTNLPQGNSGDLGGGIIDLISSSFATACEDKGDGGGGGGIRADELDGGI